MSEYKIEKNIPIPKAKGGRGSGKYPFQKMEVRDSFLYEGPVKRIQASASQAGAKNNKKFTVRKESENKYRIWRTK